MDRVFGSDRERSVEVLADRTGLSIANASQHLQQMRRAGLVANRRGGKFIYYRLADDSVLDLLAALRRIVERNLAEVERVVRSYFAERDSLEPVSREELVERSRAGTVTILDVRPEDEFALGHLPGALNIPLRALEARLGEMDPKKEIVAYCRDPYCVLSYEAVAKLRARGFRLASKMDFLNGALPACRWSPVTRERCPSADLAISTDAHAEAFHRLQACQ